MKSVALYFMFMIFSCLITAQTTFQKTYGAFGSDLGRTGILTSDGGYAFVGQTNSFGAGGDDVYLIKTNSDGNIIWTKTFGGSGNDEGVSVQQTTDGGYIIGAKTTSFGVVSVGFYLIKIDSFGNLIWDKVIDKTIGNYGYSVEQTNDGGYVILTTSNGFGPALIAPYIIKFDNLGNILWTKVCGGSGGGGGYTSYGQHVQQTSDSGYIIAGWGDDFGLGGINNFYIVKLNSSGIKEWSKTFGGSVSDYAESCKQTADGGYIITGFTTSFGAGGKDVVLMKIDSLGIFVWAKTYGGIGDDEGNSVKQTSDGGYIISGTTKSFGLGASDIYIIKTDSLGNIIWNRTFGGALTDNSYSVEETFDNGFLITGYKTSPGIEGVDVYLIKTDVNGNSGCNETIPLPITNAITPSILAPTIPASSSSYSTAMPSTTIGNGGTENTFCYNAILEESFIKDELVISPNPSSGHCILSNMGKKNIIEVYEITGGLVYKAIAYTKSFLLDLSVFSKGIYFIRVVSDDGRIQQGKLIIQ